MRRLLPLLALLAAAPVLGQPLAITSPNPQDFGWFGGPLAGVPDANGDGRDDFLVGSPDESLGWSLQQAGRAYVFDGSNGELLLTLVSPNAEERGQFGSAVAGVPDADGDGRGDLLISAATEDTEEFEGRVYLFSGASGVLLYTLESPDAETSMFAGAYGNSVSGVPDADGDRRGDLLLGAYGERYGAGRVYLHSGATGALLHTLESPNAEEWDGFFGGKVSGVEDATGDGRGDLLVGAASEEVGGVDDTGRVYLFDGATGQLLHTLVSPNPDDCSLCFGGGGNFGFPVSGVKDADGDGRGDLLVGAPFEDRGALDDAGRAYIFSGATGALLWTLVSPDAQAGGGFGSAVAGVPDVDGDGRGDLGIGAKDEDTDGDANVYDAHGRAYVFSGATGERLFTLRSPNAQPFGYFGAAGAGLGDVNGDGLGDGVVAAPSEMVGGMEYAGRVYLYRTGGADGAWVVEEAVAGEPAGEVPAALALSAAPNPLTSSTTVRVGLPRPSEATLEVLDVLGRRVALLHDGALTAGAHELRWAPSAELPGGVYLVRLRVEGEPAQVQRVTLAR